MKSAWLATVKIDVDEFGNITFAFDRFLNLPAKVVHVSAQARLCCKKSGRNAIGVQPHLPVQLRQPLQTGER